MMAHGYPPMDKTILAKLTSNLRDEPACCPWGCRGWRGSRWFAFEDFRAGEWSRCGEQCPICARCWTIYVRLEEGGPYEGRASVEIHAGWPPDARLGPPPYCTPRGEG